VSTPARKEPGEVAAPLRLLPPARFQPSNLAGAVQRAVRRNAGLRIISLLLAIGLWLFVNAGQHGALESFNVPVAYRNLPPHMLITNLRPQTVKIEVAGPRTLLSLIDPGRLAVRLDLTGVTVGQASFKINPESFNVPRQTSVVGIAPSQIVLDIDILATRDFPVHLMLTGAPAAGYHVSASEVTPRTVTVRGPSKQLAHLEEVASEPVELNGTTANLGRRVALIAPFGHARVDPAEVTANVTITPIIVEKEFHGIPIQVRESDYLFRIVPAHVNLTVRGAQLALAGLDFKQAAYVEAEGMAPGVYDATVQVTLPEGVELVHQSAMKVKLVIYRGRRTARPVR
jgi:YbbR domain-containing protein